MRYSKQRQAVYDVLCATKSHPDVHSIYNQVKKVIPNISLGTVYRNLDELCSLGMVKKVSAVCSADHYDACVADHVHFVCNTCGCITDVDQQQVSFVCNQPNVSRCDITLYGTCANCANKN